MSQPLLFNPARASNDELEQTFVGRWQLLKQLEANVLEDARTAIDRHWLLIGPRGSGKSHLTELLARRLAGQHAWTVIRLPEEQYQIGNLTQLLELIVTRIEQLPISPFLDVKATDVLELALDRIRAYRKRHPQPILVILENLTQFFDRKLPRLADQRRLREILSRNAPFVLLTTATSHVGATLREADPFYDFFHTLTLDDLAQTEVAELVEARARWDREQILLSRPNEVRARVEAIYHFSGGNPRLVLDLYSILRRGVTDELHLQLIKLLDEVTPYYQSRLRDVTPQMERVLTEMALASELLTPADIGRRCRLPTNQVTANIHRLENERLVRAVGRPDGRRRYYEVRDRLLRLWMQMREDDSRGSHLRPLTEFFQRWYDGRPDEVRDSAQRVADVFWRDLEGNDHRRCQDDLLTLEYLEQALGPDRSDSLLVSAINSSRGASDERKRSHDIELLRRHFESALDPQRRALFGILLAERLDVSGNPDEALSIIESIRDVAKGRLRQVVWRANLLVLRWSKGHAAAFEFGREALAQAPDLRELREPMISVAIRSGHTAEALQFLDQRLSSTDCARCRWNAASKAAFELVHRGAKPEAQQLIARLKKMGNDEPLIAALEKLSSVKGAPVAKDWLAAAESWPVMSAVPSSFLLLASCSISHVPGVAANGFPLLVEMQRRAPLNDHGIRHVLLAFIDAIERGKPEVQAMATWMSTTLKPESVQVNFVECMPRWDRTHAAYRAATLEAFRRLRDLHLLDANLEPWASAASLERSSQVDKQLMSMHPELREAVSLLLDRTVPLSNAVHQSDGEKSRVASKTQPFRSKHRSTSRP